MFVLLLLVLVGRPGAAWGMTLLMVLGAVGKVLERVRVARAERSPARKAGHILLVLFLLVMIGGFVLGLGWLAIDYLSTAANRLGL